MPKFGTKNDLFRKFWVGIRKRYCHISDQQTQICLIVKFYEKTKIPKFGVKNDLNKNALMVFLNKKKVLFGYFLG